MLEFSTYLPIYSRNMVRRVCDRRHRRLYRIGRNFSPNPSKRKRIASTEKKADIFRDSVSINPDGKFDDNNEEEHENPGENKDFPGEENQTLVRNKIMTDF